MISTDIVKQFPAKRSRETYFHHTGLPGIPVDKNMHQSLYCTSHHFYTSIEIYSPFQIFPPDMLSQGDNDKKL